MEFLNKNIDLKKIKNLIEFIKIFLVVNRLIDVFILILEIDYFLVNF